MTSAAKSPVAIGELLDGKYRVERVLGAGGMGVVVAARHVELDDLRAVKLMHPVLSTNEGLAARFTREGKAAVRLKGEHVTRVLDVGRLDDGSPYLVMEYLDGIDLARLIREKAPLPVDLAVDYALQTAEALSEAHAAGIVHRDVKPANLFLTTRANGTSCLKLLDFGISKINLSSVSHSGDELTKTMDVVGSPHYMAPEQVRSLRTVDGRADLWALGVILYEMLTKARPFRGDGAIEICAKVLEKDPTPPSAHRPDLPPALEAVILRCLEKDPARRFESAEALSSALRAALEAPSLGDAESLQAAPEVALPPAPPSFATPAPGQPAASFAGEGPAPTFGTPMPWGHTAPLAPRASSSRLPLVVAMLGGLALGIAALVVFVASEDFGPAAAPPEAAPTAELSSPDPALPEAKEEPAAAPVQENAEIPESAPPPAQPTEVAPPKPQVAAAPPPPKSPKAAPAPSPPKTQAPDAFGRSRK